MNNKNMEEISAERNYKKESSDYAISEKYNVRN